MVGVMKKNRKRGNFAPLVKYYDEVRKKKRKELHSP
jgi:hypothetical protein